MNGKIKKSISLMLSFIMIVSMFTGLNLQSFAAEPQIVIDYPSDAQVGDTITVTVRGDDVEGLEAADFYFYYNAEFLEFVSADISNGDPDDMIASNLLSEGLISWGGAFWPNASQNEVFVKIRFNLLKRGSSEFKAVCKSCAGVELPAESIFEISFCEHNYEAKETVSPTCIDVGYTKYVCTICGDSYNDDYVDPANDEHNYEINEVVGPTCEWEGYTTYVCTVCGDVYNDDYVSVTEHKREILETVEPFCGEDGYNKYFCSDCGNIYYDYIYATESHFYQEIETVKATCLNDGYVLYRCEKCGYEDKDVLFGHCEYENGSLYCKYCNRFALYYEIDNDEVVITGCNMNIDGEVVIPEKIENYPVTTIASSAFDLCQMTKVTIPASVTTIENDAFNRCNDIEFIEVDENNKYYSNDKYGVLFNNDKTQLIQYPSDRLSGVYVVPDGVKLISSKTDSTSSRNLNARDAVNGWGAFSNCNYLDFVVIPSSVTEIGDSESYSEDLQEYRDYTFAGCYKLSLIINGNNTGIYYDFMYNDKEIDGIDTIYGYKDSDAEEYANKHGITFVEISDNLMDNLYYEIENGEVTITGFNKSIAGDIVVPDKIEGYPVTKMQINPEDENGINFECCPMLTGITVPDSVEIIDGSFYGCVSLVNINLGDNIKNLCNFYGTGFAENDANWENDLLYIGKYLVGARCKNESTTVKDGTKVIASGAFYHLNCGCKEIMLPDGLEIICDSAFNNNKSLEKIIIPDSVTEIGEMAFDECLLLKTVVLPKNLTEIKYRTFDKCTEITEITLPDTLTKIENYAFTYTSLKMDSLIIPDSVTEIGGGAFYCAGSFKSVVIGANVESIGNLAFFCCSIEKITILNKDVEIGNEAFGYQWNGIQENVEIHGYADSTAEAYAKENGIKFVVLEEPTTQEPTTQEPTTQEPTTQEPTTQEPTTQEPTTQEPTTQEPTTQEPTTQEPTTEKPVENGELDVKDDGGIAVNAENKTAIIGKESRVAEITAAIENEKIRVLDKNGNELASDALLGTGSKVQIIGSDENVLSEYIIIVPNDIDGNAKVNAADARLALRAGAKLDVIDELCYFTAADADGNGKLNAADARIILRKAAGLE